LKSDLFIRRKEKFQRDEAHINYLLAKGLHPLEITDRLIHIMLDLMREGLKNDFPEANEKEISKKMRDLAKIYKNMKSSHKSRGFYGI
jgi:hypothetical protein